MTTSRSITPPGVPCCSCCPGKPCSSSSLFSSYSSFSSSSSSFYSHFWWRLAGRVASQPVIPTDRPSTHPRIPSPPSSAQVPLVFALFLFVCKNMCFIQALDAILFRGKHQLHISKMFPCFPDQLQFIPRKQHIKITQRGSSGHLLSDHIYRPASNNLNRRY